ncbi:MAG: FkbM family methyltransferase [Aquamicrobium sp.]|uniref:FkbM family methyltransferase n=1 Tax=Aquamicrobium sp. TaxID=1872579 RepID=UPI00349E8DDD|nr:FkbM family methyltransferase [Aquamicrobium sp.]MCO5155862.1 FkbM family methyltransferase [Aquamicrobium sp.]
MWRALRHVEGGFYIDVGAQDPLTDSVSRGLYEQGWRGVHVEANAHYAEKLRQDRPDEEVIEVAVDREPGEIVFFEFADMGLSTGDPEIARRHEGEGRECREVKVKSTSLAAILDRYADRTIHWLKIDVEGMEEAVLDGWPPSGVRPWIVVIESTLPLTQEPSHDEWEPKLLALGYEFVYFDGLNRFYVSEDHPDLKDAFGVGPNIFDGFKLAGSSDFVLQDTEAAVERDVRIALEEQFAEVQTARTDLENDLASERERSAALEQQVVAQEEMALEREQRIALEQRINALMVSRSWRITAPARKAVETARWFKGGVHAWLTLKPGSRPRRTARRLATGLARRILARPRLSRQARRIIGVLPLSVEARLRSLVMGGGATTSARSKVVFSGTEASELSSRAREIHALILTGQNNRKPN